MFPITAELTPATTFDIGLTDRRLHVVPRDAVVTIRRITTDRAPVEHQLRGFAICGDITRMPPGWGRWSFSKFHVRAHRPCPTCMWRYALLTRQHETVLRGTDINGERRLHLATDQLCRAILARHWDRNEASPDPDQRLVKLLATATAHGPRPVYGPGCSDNDCDHPENACPSDLACLTCSSTRGMSAGESAGDIDSLCHVTAPCKAFSQLIASHGLNLAALVPVGSDD